MTNRIIKLFICIPIFFQCHHSKQAESQFKIDIQSDLIKPDTLWINELTTNQTLLKAPIKSSKDTSIVFDLSETKAVSARLASFDARTFELMVVSPGSSAQLIIDEDDISSLEIKDSLLNFINGSNNQTIGQLFSRHANNLKKAPAIFDSLIIARQEVIDQHKSSMDLSSWQLLSFQNQARAYSFLFYLGRNVLELPVSDQYFSFHTKIKSDNPFTETLPNNLLYKYEIDYLILNDSISSLSHFLAFIEERTPNKDLEDFLKIIYLKELLQDPSYWLKHQHLFNRINLEQALEKESNNEYLNLISETLTYYFDGLNGKKASNFELIDLKGDTVEFINKLDMLVVLDVWATWCGPCINQKPVFEKLAKEFDGRVNFISVSVDMKPLKWSQFFSNSIDDTIGEYIVPGGFRSSFADDYHITSIPRYILIGQDGTILNGNLSSPSENMKNEILSNLE